MKKQTVSVVLATFNEEKNLSDCLESVQNFADEIIIVDGSSTDNTVEIAKKFGAKVTITENNPMFHVNKQKAIDMATKDWILQLDADERVTPQLAKEIGEKIENSDMVGYWIPRKNWFLGRFLMKGGVYPDYTLRLYKNGLGKLPQKDVHEQAVVNGKTGYLREPLIHIADPSFKRYLLRFNRYTDFIANQYKDKNLSKDPVTMLEYMVGKPIFWFFWTTIRHKAILDGWQGVIFSFFSSIRFAVSYKKYLKKS
ncbi:MAG TPA: glycosyltransferase family 2 protein [Candidatus Eisenbacteria bacterium]|nr:glycosyltransferase family 2 protein [Candidatus Eisenbacteria bacterium]